MPRSTDRSLIRWCVPQMQPTLQVASRSSQLPPEPSRPRRMPALQDDAELAPCNHPAADPLLHTADNQAAALFDDASAALEASFAKAEARSSDKAGEHSRAGNVRVCATPRDSPTAEWPSCSAQPVVSISQDPAPSFSFGFAQASPRQLQMEPPATPEVAQRQGTSAAAQEISAICDRATVPCAFVSERPKSAPPYASPKLPSYHRNPLVIANFFLQHHSTPAAASCHLATDPAFSAFSAGPQSTMMPAQATSRETAAAFFAADANFHTSQTPQIDEAGEAATIPRPAGMLSPRLTQERPVADFATGNASQPGIFSQDSIEDAEASEIAAMLGQLSPPPMVMCALAEAPSMCASADAAASQQAKQRPLPQLPSTESGEAPRAAWAEAEAAAMCSVKRRRLCTPAVPQLHSSNWEEFRLPASMHSAAAAASPMNVTAVPALLPTSTTHQVGGSSGIDSAAFFGLGSVPPASAARSRLDAASPAKRPPLRSLLDSWSNPVKYRPILPAGQFELDKMVAMKHELKLLLCCILTYYWTSLAFCTLRLLPRHWKVFDR